MSELNAVRARSIVIQKNMVVTIITRDIPRGRPINISASPPTRYDCGRGFDGAAADQNTVPSDNIIIGGSLVLGRETSAISRPP